MYNFLERIALSPNKRYQGDTRGGTRLDYYDILLQRSPPFKLHWTLLALQYKLKFTNSIRQFVTQKNLPFENDGARNQKHFIKLHNAAKRTNSLGH